MLEHRSCMQGIALRFSGNLIVIQFSIVDFLDDVF